MSIVFEDFAGGNRHFHLADGLTKITAVEGQAMSPAGFGAWVHAPLCLGPGSFVGAFTDGNTIFLRVGDAQFDLRDDSVVLSDAWRPLLRRRFSVHVRGVSAASVFYGVLSVPRDSLNGADSVFDWLMLAFADRSRVAELVFLWSNMAAGGAITPELRREAEERFHGPSRERKSVLGLDRDEDAG